MENVDQLAARAVDGVTRLTRRATRFTTWLLLGVTVIVVGGFALGVAALTGGIETVWIVLGAVFGSIAVGAAFVARWRVGAVGRHAPELAEEIRTMLRRDPESARPVIDTFVVEEEPGSGADAPAGTRSSSIMVYRGRSSRLGGVVTTGAAGSARVTAAIRALTTMPLLALVAVLITLVFGFLGFVFLIALAI